MPAAQAPARPSQPFKPQPWRDRRIEVILGNLLRTGVLVSAAVVLVGASIYLYRMIPPITASFAANPPNIAPSPESSKASSAAEAKA